MTAAQAAFGSGGAAIHALGQLAPARQVGGHAAAFQPRLVHWPVEGERRGHVDGTDDAEPAPRQARGALPGHGLLEEARKLPQAHQVGRRLVLHRGHRGQGRHLALVELGKHLADAGQQRGSGGDIGVDLRRHQPRGQPGRQQAALAHALGARRFRAAEGVQLGRQHQVAGGLQAKAGHRERNAGDLPASAVHRGVGDLQHPGAERRVGHHLFGNGRDLDVRVFQRLADRHVQPWRAGQAGEGAHLGAKRRAVEALRELGVGHQCLGDGFHRAGGGEQAVGQHLQPRRDPVVLGGADHQTRRLRRGVEQMPQQRLRVVEAGVDDDGVGRVLFQHLARFLGAGVGQHLPVVAPGQQRIGDGAGAVRIGRGEENTHGGASSLLSLLTKRSGRTGPIPGMRHA